MRQEEQVGVAVEGRTVRLRALVTSDYEPLRLLEQTGVSLVRYRHRGQTLSPENFVASLWHGVLAQFVVCTVEEAYSLGLVAAYDADLRNGHCKVAGHVGSSARSTGAGIEGFALFFSYLFEAFPFRKLYFDVLSPNLSQFANYERMGIVEEGRLDQHENAGDEFWDLHVLSLTRSAWTAAEPRFLGRRNAALVDAVVPHVRVEADAVKV